MFDATSLRCRLLGSLLAPLCLQACSGSEGAVGPEGPEGAVGSVGHDALIQGQHFDTLEGCTNGGVTLSMGTDDGDGGGIANNGVLEAGEIDDTENLCGGPPGSTGPAGGDGADGADGASGPSGATGAAGPAGATGPSGAAGDEAPTLGFDGLVAYASGDPIVITTVAGAADEVALPAFGTWASFDTNGSLTPLDLTGAPATLLNTAFTVPADGTITRLSAFFSSTTTQVLGTSVLEYGVALYVAAGADNTFEAVLDSVANFSPLSGNVVPGSADSFEFSPLTPIAVEAGSRILMVVAASATGTSPDNTLSGYFSGSIQFEETTPD